MTRHPESIRFYQIRLEEGRIIKRLKTELQTKKKTPYELDKMIQHLSRANYSVKHIASLCNVEEKTIKKYIRGLDVSEEWKKRAEEARVGLQPLTTIYELNISYDIKEFIADKYVNRDIFGYHVNDIKDGLKKKELKNIPEKKHKEIVDQLINRRSEGKTVKEVVIENSLETKYTKESYSYMHTIVLICLARIGRIFSNLHYTDYLTNEERSQVTKELQHLSLQVNPPIEWKNFSKENRKSSKVII